MKIVLLLLALISSNFSQANSTEVVSFSKDKWQVLAYSGIKPNTVIFTDKSLTINVDQSASPLIYPITKPKIFKEVTIDADLIGTLKLNANKQQGSKGNDDFTLAIGVVYQGSKKLGFFKRQMAAAWVKKLFTLAPKNVGVSHVEFYMVYQDKRLANLNLVKKKSDLIVDNYIIAQPKNGKITTTIKILADKKVLALWLASDGDDTKSKFKIKINELILR